MRPSRGTEPLTPDKVAEWEARQYSALRRHGAQAAATPVDDIFPEDPQDHRASAQSALEQLPPA
jgi:hypothetical protein